MNLQRQIKNSTEYMSVGKLIGNGTDRQKLDRKTNKKTIAGDREDAVVRHQNN